MRDLTGFWSFSEEFEFGKKFGEARLFQNNETIHGILVFKEYDEDGICIFVRCQLEGSFDGATLVLKDVSHSVLIGGGDDLYLPEEREGTLNANGQIVGTVIDADNVAGVFVMQPTQFRY